MICPYCERQLGPEHDDKACRRKSSRRFFLTAAAGAVVAAVAKKLPLKLGIDPATGPDLSVVTGWYGDIGRNVITSTRWYGPAMAENFFKDSPFLFRLKDKDYKDFYGGEWLGEDPIIYAPDQRTRTLGDAGQDRPEAGRQRSDRRDAQAQRRDSD